MVFPNATDREDLVVRSTLKSWGTPIHSGNPFCKHWFQVFKLQYINSVFTQFNLPNSFKWTLVLLVCLYTHHGRLPNERTRIFYKNSLWNGYIFRESMWNTQWEIMIFHDFHEFHMYYYDTTLFIHLFGLVGCSQVMLSLK